jgi:A/G-specific adenine glycosylase
MPADILKNPASLRNFRRRLLAWYGIHRRDLPWRRTRDPYQIWLSEIMLQQTRVAAVLEHYKSFLKRFPRIKDLAVAKEADVLAVWSGLGYYRRARMLHRAAKVLTAEHGGHLPRSSTELRQLPGIGRYTANAVASIAFGEPVAVVDGNVERVLGRILGRSLAGEEVWSAAQTALDPGNPGDFNQAMMELGATVCVPGVPRCGGCPLKRQCVSRGLIRHTITIPEKRLRCSASLLLSYRDGKIMLQQRPLSAAIMAGMWELPESKRELRREPLLRVKHSITTTDWSISVFASDRSAPRSAERWVHLSEVSQLPLTGLTRKVLSRLKLPVCSTVQTRS